MKKLLIPVASLLILLTMAGCNKSHEKAYIPVNVPAVTITENGAEIAKLSTEHFDFCSFDNNSTYLVDLGKTLEDNYLRIITDLDTPFAERIPVVIYSDLQTFHEAIGRPDASDWTVGTVVDGTIKMVSPNNAKTHSYDDMMKVIVHEFTHVVVSHINADYKSYPIWLNEGIATYEAHQAPGPLGQYGYPTLDKLSDYDPSFADLRGYEYAYTIVSFIVDEYGFGKLKELIVSYQDFETILGVSEDAFYALWTEYLEQNKK